MHPAANNGAENKSSDGLRKQTYSNFKRAQVLHILHEEGDPKET